MRNIVSTTIIGIAVIATAVILGNAFKDRYNYQDTIQVTGLGKSDFTSDLVVWSGYFVRKSDNISSGYNQLNADRETIKQYLTEKGLAPDALVFSSVEINRDYDNYYDERGKYISRFIGYSLTQNVTVESMEVDKIEYISREVTELLNKGVEFYSNAPLYYYTKLDSLKIDLIAAATKDATMRAENIAGNAGASLGDLKSASMGVFQIIAQNSNEDFSWGGAFNITAKKKTANV
ncbi:MAG: SIMPL domain-containing protein, partial [Chitinophagales bacterium]